MTAKLQTGATMIETNESTPLIFLAEDSEDDAYFFQRAFRKANVGCSLMHATNGKAALEMLEKAVARCPEPTPTLMFLDLKMPVMSGFEVLEWLQRSPFTPPPHVIVLSGSNDQDDRARALSLGASDYLVKPISHDILRERISGFLSYRNEPQIKRHEGTANL
jgi:CheY-like chemotaxis protein